MKYVFDVIYTLLHVILFDKLELNAISPLDNLTFINHDKLVIANISFPNNLNLSLKDNSNFTYDGKVYHRKSAYLTGNKHAICAILDDNNNGYIYDSNNRYVKYNWEPLLSGDSVYIKPLLHARYNMYPTKNIHDISDFTFRIKYAIYVSIL